MNKKLNLRKFLATASAFAMITGASTAALGAVRATTGVNTSSSVPARLGGENS